MLMITQKRIINPKIESDIIIVEGPDSAGKSAFVRKLAEHTKMKVKHLPPPEPGFRYFEAYSEMIQERNVIYDRFFYSQLVYGPIKRNEVVITQPQVRELELMLVKRNATLIYITANNKVLIERCKAKGEKFVSEMEIPLISARYAQVISKSDVKTIMIDTTDFFPEVERF